MRKYVEIVPDIVDDDMVLPKETKKKFLPEPKT